MLGGLQFSTTLNSHFDMFVTQLDYSACIFHTDLGDILSFFYKAFTKPLKISLRKIASAEKGLNTGDNSR